MAKRYYPKRRAPNMPSKPKGNEYCWELIHSELTEILFMLYWTRSNKEFVKVSYGGTLDQLEKQCQKICNVIRTHRTDRKDLDD